MFALWKKKKVVPEDALWRDTMSGRADIDPSRLFVDMTEIDRWRALGQDVPPPPDRGAVMQRVRQHIEALDGSVDASNGAVLDRLIEAWVAAWIASVDTAYVDACSAVSVHYGVAAELVANMGARLEYATDHFERSKLIRDDAYARLAGTDQKD
jgi:hypothetical protein